MHIHATSTFHEMTPIFTPPSVPSSMVEYTSAMFAENHLSFPAPSIEHTLIAPELRSMSHPHEVGHSLQSYAPAHPATATELDNSHSSLTSPFLDELHIGSPDHDHHQFHNHHHHHHRHSYQPTTAFQDLEEAQHLSLLQDMMHQSASMSSGISEEVFTSAAYALHPTMRRTQSFESFSPVNRRMNMTLSMANAMVGDDLQPEASFVGSSPSMESNPIEGYGADYVSMLHQNAFWMPSTSMAFNGDQFCSIPPKSASSSFTSTFQPLFTPVFSASSSCYSPATSTGSSIDSMSGRTTPATPYTGHNNYKSDYDSDIDDISCNQKHNDNQISNHSRSCSLELSVNACSDTKAQNDAIIITDCKDDDGTGGPKKLFPCPHPDCKATFARSFNLKTHAVMHGIFQPFQCDICKRAFARVHDKDRHMSSHSERKAYHCIVCGGEFARQDAVIRHLRLSAEMNPCASIIKACNVTFREVAAGKIGRQQLGPEEYIKTTYETLGNVIRKSRAGHALERMKVPKPRVM